MASANSLTLLNKLEKSSDRLHHIHDAAHPAFVPRYAVDKIDQLRSMQILPQDGQFVIVNTHGELAIEISPQSEQEFINLVDIVFDNGLALRDGKKIVKEDEIETIDFYVLNSELQISERLRCYFQNGKYSANRIIVADLGDRDNISWTSENYQVTVRSECVFVLRESSTGDKLKSFEKNWKEFFGRNREITHVVYKKLNRGNFGESFIWDHRNAYSKSGDMKVDLTSSRNILGMGDFISFSGQRVLKHHFPMKMAYEQFADLGEVLKRSSISPLKFYQYLSKEDRNQTFRIEVEARGRRARLETAHIAKQLLDNEGMLRNANIDFTVTKDRKISSRQFGAEG
ncbi:MAG: hypothetical protein QY318_03185 [Candidatus Dojkabacteria bacterium]|nr:MAG: hypothetical protein QY318_03185 [Candidatus Dojkabacteria bacterium]